MKRTAFRALPITLLIISLATFSSCKKDDKKDVSISVNGIAGNYKVTALTYKQGSYPEVDVLATMDACEKDDITNLKTDKTYIHNDSGTQCVPSTYDTGSWDVPSTTKFVLDGDEFVIESFDGTTLKLSLTDNSSGTTEIIKSTLVKQ